MTEQRSPRSLADPRTSTKLKLSVLWISLMFFYVYADILGLYQPGIIDDIVSGKIAGMEINQAFLLVSALIVGIPGVMPIFSLFLRAAVNRWTNLIVGVAYLAVLVVTNVIGGISAFGVFYLVVEAALLLLIVFSAWTWPEAREAS